MIGRRSAAALFALLFPTAIIGPYSYPADSTPSLSVRLIEGTGHGFIALRTTDGKLLASGDHEQILRDGKVESTRTLHFKDGSVWKETAIFTQQRTFTLQAYRLTQSGPAFPQDSEVTIDRPSGKYHMKQKGHAGGKEELIDGTLDLPGDLYNGMLFIVLKNMPQNLARTIHYAVFTPKPQIIEVDCQPAGTDKMKLGNLTKTARRYVFKPHLGALRALAAKLTGRMPPDSHGWVLADAIPTFLKYEGPLYSGGPIWRIELASPAD